MKTMKSKPVKQKTGEICMCAGTATMVAKPEHVLARLHKIDSKRKGTLSVKLLEFSSLQAWLDQAESAVSIDPSGTSSMEREWVYGEFDQETTERSLRTGSSPSSGVREVFKTELNNVRAILSRIGQTERMKSAKRARKPAWAGGRLNVSRYNLSKATNRPIPAFQRMTRRHDVPVKKIAINTSMSAGMQPEDFAKIVAIAAAIVETLTKAGYGIQLDICWCTTTKRSGHKTWNVTRCPIKRADEPVDVEKILSLACPGFLRDYSFRLRESFLNPRVFGVMQPWEEINDELLGYDLILNNTWKRERVLQGGLKKFLTVKGD